MLYARIHEDLVEYVRAIADDAGVSMAQATAALITYCRSQGLAVGSMVASRPGVQGHR